jgi:4-amino-4-deoxy-L-arabinose transferase-like glycosyltransferase
VIGARRLPPIVAWYGLVAALAVWTYVFGLDGAHIPRNGDESPYQHITRMTAASGAWLPLRSELTDLRNTKPPLLFWQGMVSTHWGRHWTRWDLRWPSVLYTLLTAALVLRLGWTLSGRLDTGLLACLTYLAFFSTYRYGRPFLTEAPSVFWLFVPCFAALTWRTRVLGSRLAVPVLLGLTTGVGLLYRSFALLLPVALWLAWWRLRQRDYRLPVFLARDAGAIAILSVVALATFGMWFVFDPDPRAILEEFVVEENAGKIGAPREYLGNLLWGGSSIWRLVVAYPVNAGVLMFPVMALMVAAFRRRAVLRDEERLLWMWIIVVFAVFSVPSQRDERYLLPAMPALAVLCALDWERLTRHAFTATLSLTGVAMLGLAYLSLRLEQGAPDLVYPIGYWVLVTATLALVLTALARPLLARPCVHAAILLALLSLAAFLRPFDGTRGTYSEDVQRSAAGRTVWVPINFVAREEGYRFLLPGADVRGYPADPALTVDDLAARYPLFAVRLPMSAAVHAGGVVGQRLELGSRHTSEQIRDMLRGNVFEHLFVRELLVDAEGEAALPPAMPGR